MAAVAALEHPSIALHIPPVAIVNRADHASWPAVTAGLLTPAQALTVFDRIFEGRQPPFVDSRWPVSDPLCP
ncbi:MAG: hypothetical protein EA403_15240 [Spirochaetaceae bacterium]|nr:MAG: hypothetical protein EA403_15240 [Spirochaetaceae bacterium]